MIIDTTLKNVNTQELALLAFFIHKYGTNGVMTISRNEAIKFFSRQPKVFMEDRHEGITFYKVELGND